MEMFKTVDIFSHVKIKIISFQISSFLSLICKELLKYLLSTCNTFLLIFLCVYFRCCKAMPKLCGEREYKPRTVFIGRTNNESFPPNKIKNQKYNIITFIPLVS